MEFIYVMIMTTLGAFTLELNSKAAPETVKNFTQYVESGHYDNTIFHRVIPGFMIQGGHFLEDMSEKKAGPTLKNESHNGLSNERGTIAMARKPQPHSASDQFFINTKDNAFLDKKNARDRYGYAVFGKVVQGMEVIDEISQANTGINQNGRFPMKDVPILPIIILEAKIVDAPSDTTSGESADTATQEKDAA